MRIFIVALITIAIFPHVAAAQGTVNSDLAITNITASTYTRGGILKYTISVTNQPPPCSPPGPNCSQTLNDVTFSDIWNLSQFTSLGLSWTCTANPGGSCPAVSGSDTTGNFTTGTFTLGQFATVTFTLSGTVASGTADTITNTATTNSASLTDPTPTDNTAVASSTLAVPDNLVSNTNDSGWGSLRYAIGNAAPGSTVTFDPTLFSSSQIISLTSGSLIIDRDVTIQGPGANFAAVDGNNSVSVFMIHLGITTTVSSLTIQNGKTQVDFSGGGFVNEGTLTVENSIISHNTSSIYGGGIFNQGTLTVSNSTISHNTAGSYGGGFDNHLATATIINSTISDNSTLTNGGGINNSGPLTITGSTIANNISGAGAGMITVDAVAVVISNSTFTGNVASAFAGAIQNGSNLTISNSTISGNTAKGTGVNSGGTGGVLNQKTLNLGSTIIAGNTASVNGTDMGGLAVNSLGNNVIGNASSVTGFGSSDQTGTSTSPLNAQLGPLETNGGPTQTMALQANSPAIGQGNCNLSSSVSTDQRGAVRKNPCDTGAFETLPASKVAFMQPPSNTMAGATISPAVTVAIQDANGNLVNSTANVTLAISTNPNGSTLSGTLTVAAVGGVATFNDLSIDKAATGYALSAASSGLTGATSTAFNIFGPASKVAFMQPPSNTMAGATISPAVTVAIQDANGKTVTTDTSSVTLSIGTNPSSGTLSGTLTVAAAGGVATFNDLSIDKAGLGYTVTANDGNLIADSFTLNANQVPTINSAASAIFTVDNAGSFTVSSRGVPTPTLSETGALPSGVTFHDNGDGTATLSGTPTSGGATNFMLHITASTGTAPDATQTFMLTVNTNPNALLTPKISGISANPNPWAPGSPVTFTVFVSGPNGSLAPTGTVQFWDGDTSGTLLGIGTLGQTTYLGQTVNAASVSVNSMAAGSHSITAVYQGDGNYVSVPSPVLTEGVKLASTTTLLASVTTVVRGQAIPIIVVVAPASATNLKPTGRVELSENNVSLGAGTLATVSGAQQATITVSSLKLSGGAHSITAAYSGDTNFAFSQASTSLSITVNVANTKTGVSASSVAPKVGQSVTLTASITAVVPGSGVVSGGTITFYDNGTPLNTTPVPVNAGKATLVVKLPVAGSHPITASYSGSATFNTSTSATLILAAGKGTPTVTLTANNNPAIPGSLVTFTATVTAPGGGAAPIGSLTIKDGATTLVAGVSCTSSGNVCTSTYSTSALTNGSHSITVVYSGDGNYLTKTSAALTQLVHWASSVSNVSGPSVLSPVYKQPLQFTVTVARGSGAPSTLNPTGIVNLLNGDINSPKVGSATLTTVGGVTQAEITVSTLSVSTHPQFTAVYLGDMNFAPSNSTVGLSITVSPASTQIALSSSAKIVLIGQAVTLTATVTALSPSPAIVSGGTVTFSDNGTPISGTPTVSAGKAILKTTFGAIGTHLITATYSGTGSFNTSSTTAASNVTVNKILPTPTLTSSANPATPNQSIIFTATISAPVGSAAPTGTVTFKDGTTTLSGSVNYTTAGSMLTASLSASFATTGSHSITAVYSGDSNYATKTSTILTQKVELPSAVTAFSGPSGTALYGQPLTYTVKVAQQAGSVKPTGTVNLMNDAVKLGSGTLATVSGTQQATITLKSLGVGVYSITAVYLGNTTFSSSLTGPITLTVNPADTTTTITSSLSTLSLGQRFTLTATIAAVSPSTAIVNGGTVTFYVDGVVLNATPVTVAAGKGTFTTTAFSLGSHQITAVYSGNASFNTSFNSSKGAEHTVTVFRAPTGSHFRASTSTPELGQPVTLSISLQGVYAPAGTPTGTVTILDGATVLGVVTLNDGRATFTTSSLGAGTHVITLQYSGDDNFAPATLPGSTVMVTAAPSATTATVTP